MTGSSDGVFLSSSSLGYLRRGEEVQRVMMVFLSSGSSIASSRGEIQILTLTSTEDKAGPAERLLLVPVRGS